MLDVSFDPNLHNRETWLDNGWVIKSGRGLDFYQRPASWFNIGSNDACEDVFENAFTTFPLKHMVKTGFHKDLNAIAGVDKNPDNPELRAFIQSLQL